MTEDKTYQNALEKIKIAIEEQKTTLDLRNNQLSALPPEIGKLTTLTSLDLSGNQLTKLRTYLLKLEILLI